MEKRLSGHDTAFDLPPNADDDESWVAPAAYLENASLSPEIRAEKDDMKMHQQTLLHRSIRALDDRSRDIISSRWLSESKSTLQELANRYGVSAERIRQLEASALKKMRTGFAL